MGPTILFDKSFLQSLSLDEAVLLDHFFISVICPLFYVETLADLEKAVREGRTPEDEVRIIADKTPEMHGHPCVHRDQLCIANLMGTPIEMEGRIHVPEGRPVRVGDRSGVVFEEAPEMEAFHRWQRKEFLEIERLFAKDWRNQLKSIDLLSVAHAVRNMGVDAQTCRSFEQAKQMADQVVYSNDFLLERLKLAIMTLGLPPESEAFIVSEWKKHGAKPLREYAPFAAYATTVEIFFQIAIGANLIGFERNSNRTDIGYLAYLPECMIFVSSDKLHAKVAEHFLRPDQTFVLGQELKSDLKRLVDLYKALPEEERAKGLMSFARVPPADSQVRKLWDHHYGHIRQKPKPFSAVGNTSEVNPGRVNREPLPIDEKKLVEHINQFGDAAELPMDEIDFDIQNPDAIVIKARVHPKRGSFWQLPKDKYGTGHS